MFISKKDALAWFEFFCELPEDEPLPPRQQEIALATLSQIEAAEDARIRKLQAQIPGLKSLGGRTFYVGDVKPESVKCRYEDGVLTLEFPKADQKKLPEAHVITIE